MKPAQACLCGAQGALDRRGHRALCPTCGSFFDIGHAGAQVRYDADYSRDRNHHDPALGALKRRSLDRWLRRCRLADGLAGWRVCEVGFGGAACLTDLHRRSLATYGIEANVANIAHARRLGVPAGRLVDAAALPERLPEPIDLWLFQDSFEHIPDPVAFIRWLVDSSAADARVLLVAPLAGSLSERLLGRWWPHRVPDHHFHWSRAGLAAVWQYHGFAVERQFFPWKDVSAEMVLRHAGVLAGRELPVPDAAARLRMPFNFGEIGLLLRRVGMAR